MTAGAMQPERIAAGGADAARLAQARALVTHLEAGDESGANRILDDWTKLRESELFHELGKLTRDLHEALNAFRFDARLSNLANVDIPDAKERLNYVISMTEQSASRTLGAVEEGNPLCEEMQNRAAALAGDWQRFLGREMQAQEFRVLSRRLAEFLPWIGASATKLRGNLSDVLMAQGFQDITGQIIKRVITLVEEVEQNLVNLIRLTGHKQAAPEASASSTAKLDGPQVPGRAGTDACTGQDEVDALLSSLGF